MTLHVENPHIILLAAGFLACVIVSAARRK